MKYSVVIPMYNSQDTIERAIHSVVKQTRYDLIDEIIVINDGSLDDSVLVVEKLMVKNSKIRLFNKENGGAASARNLGINKTNNQYIALLDADDIWLPQKIEKQNEILEKNQSIRALGTNRINEVILYGAKVKQAQDVRRITPFLYCIKNWPCTPSLVFDKEIFDGKPAFPEDMTHAEEGFFFLTLAYKSGLYYMNEALVECGAGKRAFGHSGLSGNIVKMHEGVIEMIKRACNAGYISRWMGPFLIIYENAKFQRRKWILKSGKKTCTLQV